MSAFDGGYYPRSWGWAALAALAGGGTILAAMRPFLSAAERLALGAFAGFVAWTAVSAARPGAATRGVPAVERNLLYLAAFWAALVLLRRASAAGVLSGLVAGATAVSSYGLARYLLQPGGWNAYEGRLLYQPLGYANAEGALAAMGAALAIGLAAHTSSRLGRAAAAAALVPLLSGLAFTSSRGAQASLVLALGIMLLLERRTARLLTTVLLATPLPLIVVWLHTRTRLGDGTAPGALVAHQGRILGAVVVLVAVAQLALAYAVGARRAAGALAVAAGLACCLTPVVAAMSSLGALGDRPAFWRAAWSDFAAHPAVGSGAGSFEVAWLRYRTLPVPARSAHNLYLETLSELGPVGLALLVLALAVPLVVVIRAGRSRGGVAVAAAGAYVLFLAHAAIDWDWQMPVLVVAALLCAAVLIGEGSSVRRSSRGAVVAWLAMAATAAVLAGAGLAANTELAAGVHAAGRGDLPRALRLAHVAARLEPWSAEPHVFGGDVQLALGNRAAARREFAAALRLDPADWQTWLELARLERPAARRAAIARAARLNPLGS